MFFQTPWFSELAAMAWINNKFRTLALAWKNVHAVRVNISCLECLAVLSQRHYIFNESQSLL